MVNTSGRLEAVVVDLCESNKSIFFARTNIYHRKVFVCGSLASEWCDYSSLQNLAIFVEDDF